jgi:hypothetical protein
VIIPALVFILSNAQVSWQIITRYHQWGAGYTGAAWQRSATLQALQALPPDIPIITNETAAVLLLADRPAYDFCGPTYDPNWPCIQPASSVTAICQAMSQRILRRKAVGDLLSVLCGGLS